MKLGNRVQSESRNLKVKSRFRQNVESLGVALFIALTVRSSVVQAFWVPSGSMLPTIQIGDHLFVNKLAYSLRLPFVGTELFRTGKPHRGEIVVFVSPVDRHTDLIKRIVAVEGDTVEIRNKQLYVNGERVKDSHAYFSIRRINPNSPRDNYGPITVPKGKFFVLGDNRDHSYDSRFWGFGNVSDIKGRAMFVYWSRLPGRWWPRMGRFGHFIR